MISARAELEHLVTCLDDEECERALALLEPLTRPTAAEFDPPVRCAFCSAVSTAAVACEAGWAASFCQGEVEYDAFVCDRCLAGGTLLQLSEHDGEWELLPGVPLPLAVAPLTGPASAADAGDEEPRPLVVDAKGYARPPEAGR